MRLFTCVAVCFYRFSSVFIVFFSGCLFFCSVSTQFYFVTALSLATPRTGLLKNVDDDDDDNAASSSYHFFVLTAYFYGVTPC